MKTLKKTLCLVLAVVMVVGVLILPAYAADDYDDAITALQNYGVLQGYPDGKLHEDANITRGQMAAIIYRIMTGDTGSTDAEVAVKYGSYADNFTDADVAPWAKGYIGFCYNASVLKGYDTGAVQPNKQISGYEVMAMLLRALGYDKNNEYTGNDWQKYVLSDATQSGISKNVPLDPAKVTPRGAVAQYTYDAAVVADRVAPTVVPNVGYASIGESLMLESAPVSGEDDFGAPNTTYTVTFTWPDYDVKGTKKITDKPLAEYWVPVTQAQVAKDAGLKKTTTLEYWLNGVEITAGRSINPTLTKLSDGIGAQGRYTGVYADRIICKDVVLGEITSVTDELVVNGYVAIEASYTATAYYGDATAAYTSDGKLLGSTTTLKKNDLFYAFCIADDSVAADGVLDDDDAIEKLVDAKVITPVSVSVDAIVYSDNGAITGLTAGNKDYMYNNTFGGNFDADDANDKLKDKDIGDQWIIYADGQGNILGLEPDVDTATTGVGVGVDTEAYRIKSGEYAAELVLLNAKGGKDTIRFLDQYGSKPAPFKSEADAIAAADAFVDNLVSYVDDDDAVTEGYTGYYVVTATTATDTVNSIDAGDADAIDASHLLSDDTVFFLANYKYSSKAGGYVFSSYTVVTGFQNIKDLGFNTNDHISGETGNVTELEVQMINKKSGGSDTAWTNYILVLNATEQAANEKNDVPNYAFIVDSNKFLKAYDDYLEYSAIVNGKAGTALKFDYKTQDTIDNTALYEYGDRDKNTSIWGEIVESENTLTGGNYGYNAGVLYDGATVGSATRYYTVVANVEIYLVNAETGTSTKLNYKLSDVIKAYGSDDLWYQLNEYGWINLIYVVGDKAVGGKADVPVTELTTVTFKNVVDKGLISSATVEATTSDNVKKATSLKWEVWNASTRTWNNVTANECFADGLTYRVTITFTAASGYVMDLEPGETDLITTLAGSVTDGDQLCTSANSIRVEFELSA